MRDQTRVLREYRNVFLDGEEWVGKVFFGVPRLKRRFTLAYLTGGHILIEAPPGLGKGLIASLFARLMDADYKRIQGTPDLLPGDIVGYIVPNPHTGELMFFPGPLKPSDNAVAFIFLADETNRIQPRTQSGLLSPMEELIVTIPGDGRGVYSYTMPNIFFLIATQNPIESEGTNELPEAQLSRFMFKVKYDLTDYTRDTQIAILRSADANKVISKQILAVPSGIIKPDTILEFRRAIFDEGGVIVSDSIIGYIVDIGIGIGRHPAVDGANSPSPRANKNIKHAAMVEAVLRDNVNSAGDFFVDPTIIQELAVDVYAHATFLKKTARGSITARAVVEEVVQNTPVPAD